MTIPDFQSLMLALLEYAGDKKEHTLREAVECLSNQLNLTHEQRKELLKSGKQTVFHNRVGWACTYMKKAVLLISNRRGYFQITERGLDVLSSYPGQINIEYLSQFPEFIQFRNSRKDSPVEQGEDLAEEKKGEGKQLLTPEESIEAAHQRLQDNLAQELLVQVKSCSADFFERLVVDLLLQMGYGGTRKDAGQAIGGSGDEGIDGIIKEDRLGFDIIYLQAKRWEGKVTRPEIQKFAGALQGQRAKKGIFITTSSFTPEAKNYVKAIDTKIILIDGEELAQLMVDFNVGVSTVATYEVKKMDQDYFTEA
ncbi:MAG: restriction endonuclease [Gomphosphaeria aponina SAG 52.96 = DSM 107014]|uniref:Restriction endonuclease n=1 Tax=Gomphosphaeria aponina SAG 52.96 = DSM 107014 TaxID=1521640 RepID=A0A941GXW3_9CHRO|nr:restriction endonuclease [Gomphosphaeria aponina SAG 52.96 = DSM 107014]